MLGLPAALLCYLCCEARKVLGFGDALDVWGVRGMGGFIGTVCWAHWLTGASTFRKASARTQVS